MNYLTSLLKSRIFSPTHTLTEVVVAPLIQNQHVRSKWVDSRMRKDARRRDIMEKYGPEKLHLTVLLRAQKILPPELNEIVRGEMNSLPKNAHSSRICHRCQLTSKGRNVVIRWRLGRMMFRRLADGNRLSGVQRARW
ncbi:unnamed protein product [Bemisia tabaci]|uniref:Ribosomal protein S14 n=1 Tax=Bemisia tabaci TaxID=7038 RepID=A0A9P0AGX6_BEMTA|nr:unnamed protein product [Bemisia tabaci]